MGFSFANMNRCLLITGLALAVVCDADAQSAGRRPGQAILFSSADDDNVSSNVPPLAAKPSGMMDFANAIQSPDSKSGEVSEPDMQPVVTAPGISPAQIRRLQQQLDEQKNWALMTPAEILRLPTQEKMLGITPRDALGQPKNETVVGKFYERQDQLRARTNGYGAAVAAPRRDFAGDQGVQWNPNIWAPTGAKPGNSSSKNPFLNGMTDNRDASAQAPSGGRSKSFNPLAPPAGSAPEQEAPLGRLLQPHPLSADNAKSPTLGSPVFSPTFTMPNSTPGQPAGSSIGKSFTPLSSGISTATPVPGIFGQTNMAPPLLTPEWKPQPPPWMSSAPQLGEIPQRKF
jgi:hypothetical protein